MRTDSFRLVDRFLLRFYGDGYACVDVFALKASEFFACFRPRRGRDTFLCSAKEKYPKERRPEDLVARTLEYTRPLRSLALRFSRKPAHAQLAISLCSKAQTGRMLHPVFTAMLGCAYGRGRSKPKPKPSREAMNTVLRALSGCIYG